ncbi:MAG: cell division protein FtsA, partial [Erysipelothrix sp.]|nr:cell division protein FtsA [Erysipelothrix sp.]
MEKQIIAALEIADREVRLLVGQFYNGRLNILKVERVSHLGVVGYTIMSESIIVDAIKKAVENASRNLGVVIESVILMVPG